MNLSIRDVVHDYGRGPVLCGVSFEVPSGDFVAVVGPNGAGKSTLLRVAAGLVQPSRGEALIGEQPVAALSRNEIARQVALVPQESLMMFHFPVLEIVLMGRHPHLSAWQFEGRAEVEAARKALSQVGLEGFEERRFQELSGGEKQRVVLARAIAQAAPILLLDEPTAFLDLRHQVEIYDVLHDLSSAGITIVAVTHDINLAGAYCDHTLALRDGQVMAHGTPQEVLRKDLLEEVYGVPLRVISQPGGGPPFFAPLGRHASSGAGCG